MSSQDGRVACDSTPGHTVVTLDDQLEGGCSLSPVSPCISLSGLPVR